MRYSNTHARVLVNPITNVVVEVVDQSPVDTLTTDRITSLIGMPLEYAQHALHDYWVSNGYNDGSITVAMATNANAYQFDWNKKVYALGKH